MSITITITPTDSASVWEWGNSLCSSDWTLLRFVVNWKYTLIAFNSLENSPCIICMHSPWTTSRQQRQHSLREFFIQKSLCLWIGLPCRNEFGIFLLKYINVIEYSDFSGKLRLHTCNWSMHAYTSSCIRGSTHGQVTNGIFLHVHTFPNVTATMVKKKEESQANVYTKCENIKLKISTIFS